MLDYGLGTKRPAFILTSLHVPLWPYIHIYTEPSFEEMDPIAKRFSVLKPALGSLTSNEATVNEGDNDNDTQDPSEHSFNDLTVFATKIHDILLHSRIASFNNVNQAKHQKEPSPKMNKPISEIDDNTGNPLSKNNLSPEVFSDECILQNTDSNFEPEYCESNMKNSLFVLDENGCYNFVAEDMYIESNNHSNQTSPTDSYGTPSNMSYNKDSSALNLTQSQNSHFNQGVILSNEWPTWNRDALHNVNIQPSSSYQPSDYSHDMSMSFNSDANVNMDIDISHNHKEDSLNYHSNNRDVYNEDESNYRESLTLDTGDNMMFKISPIADKTLKNSSTDDPMISANLFSNSPFTKSFTSDTNVVENKYDSMFNDIIKDPNFWGSKLPLNIDIFSKHTGVLLERWIIRFETYSKSDTNHLHHFNFRNKSRITKLSSEVNDGLSDSERSSTSIKQHISKDVTELMLLVQSLYSYHRQMPLYNALKRKDHDMDDLDMISSTLTSNNGFSPSFDEAAKLKVYDFNPAYCQYGLLHLKVVYDSSCGGIETDMHLRQSFSKSPSKFASGSFYSVSSSPFKAIPSVSDLSPKNSVISPKGGFVIEKMDINNNNAKDICLPKSNNSSLLAQLSESKSSLEKQNDLAVSDMIRRRNTLGSPQPSPEFHERILEIANSKCDKSRYLNKSTIKPSFLNPNNDSSTGKFNYNNSNAPIEMPVPIQSNNKDKPVLYPLPSTSSSSEELNVNKKKSTLSVVTRNQGHQPNNYDFSKSAPLHPMYSGSEVPLSCNRTQLITPRSRRISFSNTPSELFGSLVGSYEESILSGRMSALPSKPLAFVAEIGVMSLGKCMKSRLRCPKHMSVDFDSYFYEMQGEMTSTAYVGTVNLPYNNGKQRKNENGLPVSTEAPGYEIPSEGRLQVMIRNPSRTAVKVFLVQYNFRDMPLNSRTFVRQKTYVSIKDKQVKSSTEGDFKDVNDDNKPKLRYAIRVPVYRNAYGDIFVGPNLRVVFSHRAPDPDEVVNVVTEYPSEGKDKYEILTTTDSRRSSFSKSNTNTFSDPRFYTAVL